MKGVGRGLLILLSVIITVVQGTTVGSKEPIVVVQGTYSVTVFRGAVETRWLG